MRQRTVLLEETNRAYLYTIQAWVNAQPAIRSFKDEVSAWQHARLLASIDGNKNLEARVKAEYVVAFGL